jgi:hypothetical protein
MSPICLLRLLFGGAIRARIQYLGHQWAVQPSMTSSMVRRYFRLYLKSARNSLVRAAAFPVKASQSVYVDVCLEDASPDSYRRTVLQSQ